MPASLLLAALLGLQTPPPAGEPQAEAEKAAPAPLKSLSFASGTYPYAWDKLLPVGLDVDGLRVNTIFFNERSPRKGPLKGTTWGHRAQLEVTNTSKAIRTPGFAVAVLDAEGNLLGAASGGVKLGSVPPGETETFDLNFYQVKQRLPKGAKFVLSIELRD